MRKPIQSLRLILGASVTAAGLVVGPTASGAIAQERPYASEPPVAGQSAPPPVPVPVPVPPTRSGDRLEYTRPPTCLTCAPAAPPIPREITNPAWVRPPMPEFPEQAIAAGIASGRVTLSCVVLPDGLMHDCVLRNETPAGYGFAAAAIAATARARVSPRTVDGAAVGARVTFSVRYQMPPPDPVPVPGS